MLKLLCSTKCYIMQFQLTFTISSPILHNYIHVATIKDSSLFLPGSTTTTHFCHQPSESGKPLG